MPGDPEPAAVGAAESGGGGGGRGAAAAGEADGGEGDREGRQGGGRGGGGGQRGRGAAGGGERRDRAGDGAGEAGEYQAAHEVQGGGVRADQGRGRAAHAVLHGVPAAVLLSDDGRDGGCQAAGRGGDGDAGGQHHDGDRADHAGGAGGRAAVCDPGRRADGRGRRRCEGD